MKEVKEVLDGLKDFQKKSVNQAFDLFYNKEKQRLLIADEVGLGKTLIAKGIIAKAYEKYQNEGKPFHVVYICSNQALASQNLKKLNFLGENQNNIGRLLFLALKKKKSNTSGFRLSSLTPSTSFELKKGIGRVKERAIIFALLSEYDVFTNKKGKHKRQLGLERLLRGTVKYGTWKKNLKESKNFEMVKHLKTKFRSNLMKEQISRNEFPETDEYLSLRKDKISLWKALCRVCEKVGKKERDDKKYSKVARELIGSLRKVLTALTVENLNADLFILDEFQRFKDLIDDKNRSDAGLIARAAFSSKKARVLMLSATPFKPYTDRLDEMEGEEHYGEFKKVLEFLQNDKDSSYWEQLELDRKAFFDLIKSPKGALADMSRAMAIKNKLEDQYRQVISRNERAIVIENGKSLVKEQENNRIQIQDIDVNDFIKLDRVVREINKSIPKARYKLTSPIEFSKSVPFPLSFSENYKLNSEIKKRNQESVKLPKAGFLEKARLQKYLPPKNSKYPNGKMRKLLEEALTPAVKMLWIPPSFPYYEPFGAYKDNQNYSKTLVFSGWAMVPSAISAIVSYEAERLTIGKEDVSKLNEKSKRTYFRKNGRLPKPKLVLGPDDGKPKNMTNYCLLYPSFTLADVISIRDYKMAQTHDELLGLVKEKIKAKLGALKKHELGDKVDLSWYWIAPFLLDIEGDSNFDLQDLDDRCRRHRDEIINSTQKPNLGRMPEDLAEVLAEMALGSPGVIAYRTLQQLYDNKEKNKLIEYALDIANGFFSLFNKPESISIVRMSAEKSCKKGYWYNVLSYCISGNIQAMMDEYAYMLKDSGAKMDELVKQIVAVLSIRSATISVENASSIKNKKGNKMGMRAHFAVSFGTQAVKSDSGSSRMVTVREAFNAPFRPFVLASTSIGQEGLDFHYYCRKIVHWNLPSNAIDIEQREGRINRYKGLVIRANIAKKYQSLELANDKSVWCQLFARAENAEKETRKNEMIPFWHLNHDSDINIERSVPLYPLSKDIKKYEKLKKVLAVYRLTFGQPRQEELVEILNKELSPEMISELKKKLLIDLSPR